MEREESTEIEIATSGTLIINIVWSRRIGKAKETDASTGTLKFGREDKSENGKLSEEKEEKKREERKHVLG